MDPAAPRRTAPGGAGAADARAGSGRCAGVFAVTLGMALLTVAAALAAPGRRA